LAETTGQIVHWIPLPAEFSAGQTAIDE